MKYKEDKVQREAGGWMKTRKHRGLLLVPAERRRQRKKRIRGKEWEKREGKITYQED